jgi:hypothetical protein
MSKIVYIQTLFCPTQEMFEANKKSIESFGEYFQSNPYDDIEFIFAGYVEERYVHAILEPIRKYFKGRSKFLRVDKNYGKAYVINKVSMDYINNHPENKYIFTLDHDIVFINNEQNKDMFNRLIKASDQLSKIQARPFGLIAVNLDQSDKDHPNAHWLHKFDKRFNWGNEIISWPSNAVGVAGGCLFINTSMWKDVNGYRVMGVYAPDDAALMQDSAKKGYTIGVLETIHTFHPDTHNDKNYHSFKSNILQVTQGMSYDSARQRVDTFWNNQKKKERLHLPSVTLAIVDCLDLGRAIKAVEYSKRNIDFGDIKILTSIQNDHPNSVKIDCIRSKEEYSFFCIKLLHKYIDTPHVLLIQYDGFVLNHEGWQDDFLKYDYVGPPWWFQDGHNVGNGGFSLRSQKLLNALQDEGIKQYHPEDAVIGRTYRTFLENKYGVKFAPEVLADRFGIEWSMKTGWELKGRFGFHGFDILKLNNIRY